MADPRKLKDKAAEAAAKGKLDKAADLLREVLRGDRKDVAACQQLAEVLRRAGNVPEAIQAYQAVADRFAHDGLLIKAIAISKTILELDPAHVETQGALADLYAKKAVADRARPPVRTAFMAAVPRPAPPHPSAGPAALAGAAGRGEDANDVERAVAIPLGAPETTPPTAFARIVSAAEAGRQAGVDDDVVIDVEPVEDASATAPAPPAAAPGAGLPHVPIFSDLSREAFVALTRAMVLRRVGKSEVVLSEGDGGTSFYVVATGKLAVSKRDDRGDAVVMARLGDGDFFGEMALLSGAPRAATVIAEEPSELLEFCADVLLDIAARHPQLAASLRRFYRQRLLAGAMAVSPIFRPFGKGDRKLIMERFRAREVSDGEVVILEGEPSDGLYVVLDGMVEVVKRKDGAQVVVGRLRQGDLFGEMSCLRKTPASATVVARRGGTLLRLPRREFDELVTTYPQILELVAELTDERAENLDAILTGHAQWTEDGLVLV